jgi:hypothetical protein
MHVPRSQSSPSLLSELSERTGLREVSSRLTKSPCTVSYAFQTIEIDADDLHCFVKDILSQHVKNKECPFFRNLQHKVRHLLELAEKKQDIQLSKTSPQEQQPISTYCTRAPICLIDEIILSLQTVIQSTPSLPASMTAQVHSMIGLLRQKKGYLKGAIKSFLKALWIQSHLIINRGDTNNNQTMRILEIGITRHRLGMAYGRSGNFADAMVLLERAMQDYEQYQQARPCPDCHCVPSTSQKRLLGQVKADLDTFTEARMLEQAHLTRKIVACPNGRRFPFKYLAMAPGVHPTFERRSSTALAA